MRRAAPLSLLCMLSSAFAMRAPLMRPQLPQQLGGATLLPVAQHARLASRSTHMMAPWDAPTDWFVYGHLHLILALPTLTLLSLSPPLQRANPLQKQMSYAFIVFIVCIGVAQSFIWDSYGASMGFWEFNPDKCTSRDDLAIPIEEVLWLFHHVLKTALYQLKAFELVGVQPDRGVPSAQLRASVSALLVAACAFGVWALALSPDDTVKCIGLVCAFFAPVWLVIWQIGSQFVLRHANRITIGWFLPGVTTVLIDCLGQQQGVWRFPEQYLSGISLGYLKLDIVLVYMVRAFAASYMLPSYHPSLSSYHCR